MLEETQETEMAEKEGKALTGCVTPLIFLGIIIGVFVWIAGLLKNDQVYIFNPHNEVLTVELNDETISVQPREQKEVELRAKDYQIRSLLKNQVIIDTNLKISDYLLDKGGILNLSGEPMYLWSQYFGNTHRDFGFSQNAMKNPLYAIYEQSMRFIEVDSTMIYGNVKVYPGNELMLKKEWQFGLDEPMKDKIEVKSDQAESGVTAEKLFYKQELLRFWKRETEGMFLESADSTDAVPFIK